MHPASNQPKKAVIFTRVSSVGQEDNYSLEAQHGTLNDYCRKKSLDVIKTVKAVETSTKLGLRKVFHQTLEFIHAQKTPTALVVHTTDRLLRRMSQYGLIEELCEKGHEIHIVQSNQILRNDDDFNENMLFMFQVMASESYVRSSRINIQRGVAEKIRQGGWPHKAPVGYLNDHDPETGRAFIKLDPARAILVRRLFQHYATGLHSIHELTAMAAQWGLTRNTRKATPLCQSSIDTMLKNPFYHGQMRIKDKLHQGNHEPLIDKALFDRCADVREGKRTKPMKQSLKPFIFRGLIECGHCGRTITTEEAKGNHYLFCAGARNKANCKNKRTTEIKMLAEIERILDRLTVPEPMLNIINQHLMAENEAEHAENAIVMDALFKDLKTNEAASNKLLDLCVSGRITDDQYDKRQRQLQKQRKDIHQQLEALQEDRSEFRDALILLLKVFQNASKIFKSSNLEQKRQIIGFISSNLILKGGKLVIELNTPFDLLLDLGGQPEWWRIGDSNP